MSDGNVMLAQDRPQKARNGPLSGKMEGSLMTDDSLLDTPIPPAVQALAARLTLASVDGDPDRVHAGLGEAVADANTAVAVIGLLVRHLAITMVGRHGEARTPAMLQKVILDAGGTDQ